MTCMMSTLEEISLRPVDGKDVVDDLHTGRAEPLEQDDATENAQGTLSSSEAGTTIRGTTSWWNTVFTTAATLLANSFLNAGISMIAPFYPIVAQRYLVAVYIVGFVIGVAPLCVTVMSPLVGYFLPHLGLKFTQLAGLCLAGGSLILFGFVSMMPSQASFMAFSFLLRIIEGIGTAMYVTASYTQLTTFYPEKKGTVVGLVELSLVLGIAAGPAVGGGLADAGGFWLPFVVVGGCIVVLMLLLGVLLIVVIPPTECTSVKLPWRLVLRLFTNIVFISILVSLILAAATVYAGFSYFGKFLHEQFNLRLSIIGVVYLASTTAYAVGTVIVGPITDRLKTPRYLIIIGLVITAVACVFIGPAKFITTPKLWLSIVADTVLGAGLALLVIPVYPDLYGIAQAIHVDVSETAITSTVSGIFVGSNSAGECLGAIIGGGLAYQVGFQSMAAILGLVLLVCALLLFIITVIQKSVTRLKFNRSNKQ